MQDSVANIEKAWESYLANVLIPAGTVEDSPAGITARRCFFAGVIWLWHHMHIPEGGERDEAVLREMAIFLEQINAECEAYIQSTIHLANLERKH